MITKPHGGGGGGRLDPINLLAGEEFCFSLRKNQESKEAEKGTFHFRPLLSHCSTSGPTAFP